MLSFYIYPCRKRQDYVNNCYSYVTGMLSGAGGAAPMVLDASAQVGTGSWCETDKTHDVMTEK
jgi:hypothetical protein